MKLRPLFIFLLLLALPALSCALLGGDGDVDVVEVEPDPGAEPENVVVEPTPAPTPLSTRTLAPRPTPTTAPLATLPAIELAAQPYFHPAGIFSLRPPAGWTISDTDASASFDAADGSGFIYVQVTDTGHPLDASAFENFVENRDLNTFGAFENYTPLESTVDVENGIATVSKSFTFEQAPQIVITVYERSGAIIYSYDFWMDETLFEPYTVLYEEVLGTVETNPDRASEQPEYNWVYTFTGPDGLFAIDVPMAWEYVRDEGGPVTVDTFLAPDEHAVIQNITYDEGLEISRSEAGDFALELLREYYANDITIIDDQVQADGSERLVWESRSGDYSGISFFETRGTTFLLFTVMYDNPFEEIYLPTLNHTIESYTIPN
ncbi:MAG: hypothetical protein R3272_09015 [Candidatus Promineifilaceae bacterium]|nr:hypothetical protein [Candidatus Promineifilaceae bacterium]